MRARAELLSGSPHASGRDADVADLFIHLLKYRHLPHGIAGGSYYTRINTNILEHDITIRKKNKMFVVNSNIHSSENGRLRPPTQRKQLEAVLSLVRKFRNSVGEIVPLGAEGTVQSRAFLALIFFRNFFQICARNMHQFSSCFSSFWM